MKKWLVNNQIHEPGGFMKQSDRRFGQLYNAALRPVRTGMGRENGRDSR